MHFFARKYGAVEDVSQAGLKMTIQISHHQHFLVLILNDVAVLFEYHVIHGQGTGLVGTKDVHGTQVLDGVQPFNDNLLFDIIMAPFERQTVTIIGSISGVNPTATARAKKTTRASSPWSGRL